MLARALRKLLGGIAQLAASGSHVARHLARASDDVSDAGSHVLETPRKIAKLVAQGKRRAVYARREIPAADLSGKFTEVSHGAAHEYGDDDGEEYGKANNGEQYHRKSRKNAGICRHAVIVVFFGFLKHNVRQLVHGSAHLLEYLEVLSVVNLR